MDIKTLPKAELHVHIEGTITPDLARKLAQRNGIQLPDSLDGLHDRYYWDDFNHFLNGYDLVADCIRSGEDYEDVVYDYLSRCAAEGVVYVEFFGSQDHGEHAGLPYPVMLDHLVKAIDKAEADFGIICRIIMTCIRHLGPERALEVVKTTVEHPHPYVVGFGIAGDEKMHHPSDFAETFRIARDAGLPCTAHAGEVDGPQSIRDALEYLKVVRIGHGVRAIEDPQLVEKLAAEAIALEVCPGSNIALKVYEKLSDHPFKRLLDAGCNLSLSSDDPPHFGTTVGQEYEMAAAEWSLDATDLRAITEMAIKASFADSQTKAKLLEKLSEQ